MIHIPDSIYSKDPQGNALCPRCKKLIAQCDCPSYEQAKPKAPAVKPVVRLDKSGRKGKVVTLISALPANEAYLKDLAKQLKTKTGSGGTYYIEAGTGIVEVQGNHKGVVEKYFKDKDQ